MVYTPTEIGKNPKLIRIAQEELAAMDVLVCGRCLCVFHFIEEFRMHKTKTCQRESNSVRECNDNKPKIWAFLLWKASRTVNGGDAIKTDSTNSWGLYQTWVKMDESLRDTWVVAGKTILSFAKVEAASLCEMPVKITKTVVNSPAENAVVNRKTLAQTKPQVANLKVPVKLPVVNKSSDGDTEGTPPTKAVLAQKVIKKTISPTVPPPATGRTALVPRGLTRRAKRTVAKTDEIVDDNVEKIVAKRFNPTLKMYEFLVKWDGRMHDYNSWEPQTHLETVPHLVELFEKQLARQKENRAKQLAAEAAAAAAKEGKGSSSETEPNQVNVVTPSSDNEQTGRPIRTSKAKAMDQVKQWVSNQSSINDMPRTESNTSSVSITSSGASLKRKQPEDTANMLDGGLAMSLEDFEEELIPSHTVKRMKNGTAVTVESKTIVGKVNGTPARTTTSSLSTGESLPIGPHSADVILTNDATASGVVKKPGGAQNKHRTEAQVRVISRKESAVSNTGIVRLQGTENTITTEGKIAVGPPRQPPAARVTSSSGRQTPNSTTASNAPTISSRQHVMQRTAGGTTIQRRVIPGNATNANQQAQQPQQQLQQRTVTQRVTNHAQLSPTSGRMIIPRPSNPPAQQRTLATAVAAKTVTPEQKILQLSKSGDLKVTKKVMTREDAAAQRLTAQQRNQQLRQQHQQSQVQIQKVQQITPPGANARTVSSVSVRRQADGSYTHEETQYAASVAKAAAQEQQQLLHQAQVVSDQQQQVQQEQQMEMDANMLLTGDQSMLTNEDGTPLLVTGEDGTVYQVAGRNAEGQTILVTQGPDGEQQYAYVASAEGDENQVLTLDNAVAEAVGQMPGDQQAEALATTGEGQYLVKTTQEDGTTHVVTMSESELAQHQALAAAQQQNSGTQQLCIQTGGDNTDEGNIPAEVVQADLPSPGGTRRVVLLLQDGTFMMTEMQDEEFKALNITT